MVAGGARRRPRSVLTRVPAYPLGSIHPDLSALPGTHRSACAGVDVARSGAAGIWSPRVDAPAKDCNNVPHPRQRTGWVAEWFKAAVLKTAVGASPP